MSCYYRLGVSSFLMRGFDPVADTAEFGRELDPTNAIVGNRDLIRVAVARDPSQAVPLWGAYFGTANDFVGMAVEVRVRSD
jgi:hypothetical protein